MTSLADVYRPGMSASDVAAALVAAQESPAGVQASGAEESNTREGERTVEQRTTNDEMVHVPCNEFGCQQYGSTHYENAFVADMIGHTAWRTDGGAWCVQVEKWPDEGVWAVYGQFESNGGPIDPQDVVRFAGATEAARGLAAVLNGDAG